jgi:hypothetical protein
MSSPSRAQAGDRVRLVTCNDEHTSLKPGDLGTVQYICDAGTLHIKWDNGSTLGLIPGVDEFEILYSTEPTND